MVWDTWKRVFFAGAGIWLFGTVALLIARTNSRDYSTMRQIDNINTIFALISVATFVLGVVLLCRWVWLKIQASRPTSEYRRSVERPRAVPQPQQPPTDWAARWDALVKYDDEIRTAAEKLLPFGTEWRDRLGEAFFALNENRSYLTNIVERLLDEAKLEAEREKLEAEREWKGLFRRTANGEFCTRESLAILSEARKRGYKLGVQSNGAFAVTNKSSLTSFFYSNEDIERFGRILSGRPD
jgi:hypothetical protein